MTDEEALAEANQRTLEHKGRRAARFADGLMEGVGGEYVLICFTGETVGEGCATYLASVEREEVIATLRDTLDILEQGKDVAPIQRVTNGEGEIV